MPELDFQAVAGIPMVLQQPIFLRDSVRIYKGQSGLTQVASGGVGQT